MDPTTAPERTLQIRRVSLDALHLDPANARKHGAENMAAIAASLRRFGQAEPLVVHAGTGRVIGGNGRLAAMRSLGWTECDVVELDLAAIDATALGIALNRTGELAEWDDENLARLLQTLQAEDALEGVGFDDAQLDELLAQFESEAEDLEDVEPGALPEEPVTRPGDLWALGDHRLLCGNSTDPASFQLLLGTEHADLVWTDPPYGVSYVGGTDDALTIANDELEGDDLRIGVPSYQLRTSISDLALVRAPPRISWPRRDGPGGVRRARLGVARAVN